MYLTGDIKRKVGVTIKQINRWTELGWVSEMDKTENGYRIYDEEALERFRLIRFYRILGMGTQEISKALEGSDDEIRKYYQDQICVMKEKMSEDKKRLSILKYVSKVGVDKLNLSLFDNMSADEITDIISKGGYEMTMFEEMEIIEPEEYDKWTMN